MQIQPRTGFVLRLMVLAAALLPAGACSSSLLGPEDVNWDEFCTVYVSEADQPRLADVLRQQVSKEQLRRCRPLNVYVVKFTD